MRFLQQLNKLGGLLGLTNDVDLRKLVERLSGAEQDDRMIVCNDDFYSLAHLLPQNIGSSDAARITVGIFIFSLIAAEVAAVKASSRF
ncbi:hypothetical protein [Caballeronia sp. HLA56]